MAVRITCVNKSDGGNQNPHEAIASLGWLNEETQTTGISTRLEIYDFIKNRGGQAYVVDRLGNKTFVGALENANGTKYVKTYADGVWTDNLLALPRC